MRVLVVLALTAIIVFLVRGFLRRLQAPTSPGKSSSRSTREAEPMRQCAHCGAYFPASEAVGDSPDKLFCSDEHRRQHLDSA